MFSNFLTNNMEQRILDLHFRLKSRLQEMDELRETINRTNKKYKTTWIPLIILSIILGITIFPYFFIATIILSIWALIKYSKEIGSKNKLLKDNFETYLVLPILDEFLDNSSYQPNNYINEEAYIQSGLFKKSHDRYQGDTLIQGIFDETFIQFSRLETEYEEVYRNKDGKKRSEWHTIFKGIFCIIDCNKNFKYNTLILTDSAEKTFGNIGRWIQEKVGNSFYREEEMVYMENPIFEKEYVVYADDPVEARYLLTPTMQENFVALANSFGEGNIQASFKDNKLYLAIRGKFDLFKFQSQMSLILADTLKYYSLNLISILSVIKTLELNKRV